MAGIYIHIPYCKQACHYCDFHFSTVLKHKNELIAALLQEIALQKSYLKGEKIESIYFGGGTPSLLTKEELASILESLDQHYDCTAVKETTIEVNPDDMSKAYLADLKSLGINRLSVGIQSFREEDLTWMNRSHNSKEALDCLENVKAVGFDSMSLDLIYGFPDLTVEAWKANIAKALSFDPEHISCYSLTVEEKTALAKFIAKGTYAALDDQQAIFHFNILMEEMRLKGYEHYEISNFAKPGKYALHNTGYWQRKKYLGLGPAAHSFNGEYRQWNINNNAKYIAALAKGELPYSQEKLEQPDQFNEYLMTSLRTMWGCDLEWIHAAFGEAVVQRLIKESKLLITAGFLYRDGKSLKLTKEGKFMADSISSQLFWV